MTTPVTPPAANDLPARWRAFELEEFPPACLGRPAGGMTCEQADALAAACISTFLKQGRLDAECRTLLDGAIADLAHAMKDLESTDKAYFERLLNLAREVRIAAAGADPIPPA